MLPAIKHVEGDIFVFQQDNAQSCLAKDTIKLLQQETPDFTGPDLWPSDSPDLNQVDYKVWGVMQQGVYEVVWTVSMRWSSASLKSVTVCSIIDAAINEWRKQLRACMRADGQHLEHLLWARVTDKSYGQIM